MTTQPGAAGTTGLDDGARLGRAVAGRLRLPGPPVGRPLHNRVGSLASSVRRFATALSRPVEVRQALRGPGEQGGTNVRPPRWWVPATSELGGTESGPAWLAPARRVEPAALGARGLPRAARSVPDEQSYTPGGMLTALTSVTAPVRRHAEVAASGPMLTQQDQHKLTAGIRRKAAVAATAATAATAASGAAAAAAAPAAAPSAQTIRRSTTVSGPAATGPAPSGPAPPDGGGTPAAGPAPAVTSETGPSAPGATAVPTASAVAPVSGDRAGSRATQVASGAGSAPRTTAPPWQLASPPTRFPHALRRSTTIGLHRRVAAYGRQAFAAPAPVQVASLGLLDRAPGLPSRPVPTVVRRAPSDPAAREPQRPRPVAVARSADRTPGAGPRSEATEAPPTSPSPTTAPTPLTLVRTASGQDKSNDKSTTANTAGAAGATGATGAVRPATIRRHARLPGARRGATTDAGSSDPSGTADPAVAAEVAAEVAIPSTTARSVRRSWQHPVELAPATDLAARRPGPGRVLPVVAGPVAMPDQLTVRRQSRHGRRDAALASGFGRDVPIQPATVTAPRSPAPGSTGTPSTTGPLTHTRTRTTPSSAMPTGAMPTGAMPSSATTTGAAQSSATIPDATPTDDALPAPPAGLGGSWAPVPGGPAVPYAGRATSGVATQAASPGSSPSTALLRRFPVAPPRTGPVVLERPAAGAQTTPVVRRSAATGPSSTAPPTPATAPPAAPTRLTADEINQLRAGAGSLIDRTAHLFSSEPDAIIRRTLGPATGGTTMPHDTPSNDSPTGLTPLSAPRPDETAMLRLFGGPLDAAKSLPSEPWRHDPMEAESAGALMARLVDAVVDRIEDRVIDELDRRGRHNTRVI